MGKIDFFIYYRICWIKRGDGESPCQERCFEFSSSAIAHGKRMDGCLAFDPLQRIFFGYRKEPIGADIGALFSGAVGAVFFLVQSRLILVFFLN